MTGDAFVITLDDASAQRVALHYPGMRGVDLPLAGGKSTLHAQMPNYRVSSFSDGNRFISVVGTSHVPESSLRAVLRAGSVESVSFEGLPEPCWAIVSIADELRVQGNLSGVNRIYWAPLGDGRYLIANRARVLAQLCDRSVDPVSLSLRLLQPLPYPLDERSCWDSVFAASPHEFLHVSRGRKIKHRRWWWPPEATRTQSRAAIDVRAATLATMQAHLTDRDCVSFDISGGLDSSTLLAVAKHLDPQTAMHGVTGDSRDSFNTDLDWAKELVSHLGLDSHVIVPPEEMTNEYDDLHAAGQYQLDEPSVVVATHTRLAAMFDRMSATGSELHFTGFGGDQLFCPSAVLCYELARTHPTKALRLMRHYAGRYRWNRRAMIAQMTHSGEYGDWLADNLLTIDDIDSNAPMMSWGIPNQLPRWMTKDAGDAVVDRVQGMRTTAPLAETPGRHYELDMIYDAGRMTRAISDMSFMGRGLHIVAPLLDRSIIDAAFTVRVDERLNPYAYKPLLIESFRDILPNRMQQRRTKGGQESDKAQGLFVNAGELADLWSDSRLAAMGIIDGSELERLLRYTPDAPELEGNEFLTTLACELWARSV